MIRSALLLLAATLAAPAAVAATHPTASELMGSAARCVGRECELPFNEQRDSEAQSGFCGREGRPEDAGRVSVYLPPHDPRVVIYWRVEADVARAVSTPGAPPVELPGSHMMLIYQAPTAADPPFAGKVVLTGFTLGFSFGWQAPLDLAGPRPQIALKVGHHLYGPYAAGHGTYRAAIKLKPHANDAVPETAIADDSLAVLAGQLAADEPAELILTDAAGHDVARAPLVAAPMKVNLADAIAWTDTAAARLARGRCPD